MEGLKKQNAQLEQFLARRDELRSMFASLSYSDNIGQYQCLSDLQLKISHRLNIVTAIIELHEEYTSISDGDDLQERLKSWMVKKEVLTKEAENIVVLARRFEQGQRFTTREEVLSLLK